MATTPCTLAIITEDRINFPVKMAYVVLKQLFQYGVKSIEIKGEDKVFVSLTYSPKERTLRKKFGNLPLRYMRTKLKDAEEFKILETVIRRYQFNLVDDQSEDGDTPKMIESVKRRRITQPKPISIEEYDDNEEAEYVEGFDEAVAGPSGYQ